MKKHFAIGKKGKSTPSNNIEFDVEQLDVLVREKCQSSVNSRDGRPFLSAMALQHSRQILCYAITMKCPSASQPLKNLVFPKHFSSMPRGFNLFIHADRTLFSPKLIEKHFRTAIFSFTSPHSTRNCLLEHTLSKLMQNLETIMFLSANYGHAVTPNSLKFDDLKRLINHSIESLNIIDKNRLNS